MKTYIIHTKNGKTFKITGDVIDLVSGNDGLMKVKSDNHTVGFFSIQNIAFIADAEFVKTSK